MKRGIYYLSAIILSLLTLSSCNQTEERGRLTLGFDLVDESLQKSASTDDYLSYALLTIVSEDGSLIYDKEPVELIHFGTGLVTRSLELPVGGFMLSEFMLTDTAGMVLWATPKAGSRLAGLVNEPLPQSFRIHADQSTSVNIQVIRVGTRPPEDFGYVEFNIDFIERFCLKVEFANRFPDCGNDSLMGPEGSMMPYYQSRLIIYAGERLILNERLDEGLNRFELPIVSKWYLVTATGCDGQTFFKQDFSLDELSMFSCDPNNPPLVIHYGEEPNVIITPEGLYQPTIKQGVFGQITGPLDSFMDSSYYDVQPLIQDICFFPYHVLDSLYTFAPINCFVSFDMVPWEPLVTVRSNSEGFFQLKLEAGEYLYMVKTEEGYYMDAYISSHRPGHVMVYPEEVSELSIHVVDCSMWQ